MKLAAKYMSFYAIGRCEDVDDEDTDIEDIAKKVMRGDDLRAITLEIATKAAAPLSHGREKREWLEEYADEIVAAGGDKEEAHRHYVQGRVEQHAHALESDVVDELGEDLSGDDDEDDEEEDDEEEDDEEEDDEDGDDDEDEDAK